MKTEIEKTEFLAMYKQELLKLQDEIPEEDRIELLVENIFSPGIYMRKVFAPKSVLLIGKTHKTEHLNIMLEGKANVMIDGVIKQIQAPSVVSSKAGAKKVFYVLEDMVWATIHPTEETDLDLLKNMLVLSDEEEKEITEKEIQEVLCPG
jgi:hypothetical protein